MNPTYSIRRVGAHQCTVGEGPVWDEAEQALYFVDLVAAKLHRHDPATESYRQWPLPSMVGSIALRRSGGAVVALQDGLHALNLASGAVHQLVDPQPPGNLTQFNDGKVDRLGRFVVGTQPRSLQDTRPLGSLYSFEADGRVRLLDAGFQVPNGPCWSPDNRHFYIADSARNQVYVYDYDIETGCATERRDFAVTSALGGFPDGATVDADGNLWVAVCLSGKIVCYRPDGSIKSIIPVPVRGVASVMFGGPDLTELYFTSISNTVLNGPPDELSGSLFVITNLGARGLPEPRFDG
jgi:sugar lactone lactonase YvrE